MRRPQLPTCLLLMTSFAIADEQPFDLSTIDRTIAREPVYESQPHYALFVFGPQGADRSWLVVDGDRVAYIDRNGNGDLTDPEDRVAFDAKASEKLTFSNASTFSGMHRFPLGEVHGTRLEFDLWVRNPDFEPTKETPFPEHLRKWDSHGWVNGSLMRTAADGSRAQNPLLLTPDPATAQISRFGGPVSIGLKWRDRQRLEAWPKRFVFDVHLGHRNLPAKGSTVDGFRMTVLTTSEVPEVIKPIARFEYASVNANEPPMTQTVRLDRRCCGDTFYTEMTLPKGVAGETAKVTVHALDWTGHGSQTAEFDIPIRAGVSERSEAVYILFERDDVDLFDAVGLLRKEGLDVFVQEDSLQIHKDRQPAYGIQLRRGGDVKGDGNRTGSRHEVR